MLMRTPYSGARRQLILAFDIGITYSAISYAILTPGEVPNLGAVLRFPGQGQVCDCKLPSVMYYDPKGNLKAVGYETQKEDVVETAIAEDWVKLECWALHFCKKHPSYDDKFPPLPNGKSITHVLRDFITYLFQCSETYIRESYAGNVWESIKDEILFAFTCPNVEILRAVELARLIPGTPDGRARVRFLTEGAASLYFCIWDMLTSRVLDQEKHPDGQGVVVIDAGANTIDLSMYSIKLDPITFEEIAPAECRLQGSAFVTRRAKVLLEQKLRGSRYSSPEMIEEITDTFDRTTKLRIRSAEEAAYIKVGSLRENDSVRNIKAGNLKLHGQEVTGLFDSSIHAVIDAFEQQRSHATIPITMAFLVGGFGANDWLWSQLQLYFKSQGVELLRPGRVHKAVQDGAVLFVVDHLAEPYVARAKYGPTCAVFRGLLHKGVQADNDSNEVRYSFRLLGKTREEFGVEAVDIICYRGEMSDPQWIDCDDGSFSTLCTIRVDLAEIAKTLTPRQRPFGPEGFHYTLRFEVIVSSGSTKISTQVAWKVNGAETRSPAMILYNEN